MDKYEIVIRKLVNRMLEPYGKDYDYVMACPEIEGELWCTYYTWTDEESNKFEEWAIDTLRKDMKWSKEKAEKEYGWFNLMYGLKIKE